MSRILIALSVAACSSPPPPLPCAETSCEARSYDEIGGDVTNPERGFFRVTDLDDGDLESAAEDGVSLVNVRFVLDDFREVALTGTFLDELDAGFANLRDAGLKAVVRFQYNEGSGEDAALALVLEHIDQLAPVLDEHADVIAVLQAGFIGAWGEWHSSSSGLDDDASRAAILDALLAALPAERMVQVRSPLYKDTLSPGGPLDEGSAFGGDALARTGHHDDCLLADDDDEGTYPDPIEQWRAYVADDSRFVPVGGEPCRVTPNLNCSRTVQELETMHWSFLNGGYPEQVIAGWRSGGCHDDLGARLGYRFVLRRSSWTEAPVSGGTLTVDLEIENRGFAAPYGSRDALLILDGPSGRLEFPLTGEPETSDPRRWLPGPPILISQQLDLSEVAAGDYRLSLWLPDPSSSLRARAEYAIRLANPDLWDEATGENVLEPVLTILP